MRHRVESVRVAVNCHFCNSTNVIVTDHASDHEPVTGSSCGAPLGKLADLRCRVEQSSEHFRANA